MNKRKYKGQEEYMVDGEWMPEGARIDWGHVTQVRRIFYLTQKEFIAWARSLNKRMGLK